MEQTTKDNSKWGQAAKEGLILASITVVISTLTFLTENSFLSGLLWLVKLVGSIWLLRIFINKYGEEHLDESPFGYGVVVCVLSAIVCAVWSFVEYQFLFPDAVAKAFDQALESLSQMGGMMPDGFEDVMLKMEDNYAQINCITTFFWCSLLGILFSAIIARPGSRKNNVFTEEEMKQNNDDEFNF